MGDRRHMAEARLHPPAQVGQQGLQHLGDAAGRQRGRIATDQQGRSEEHTSELQSLMRISYAVFCLKTKKIKRTDSSWRSLNYRKTLFMTANVRLQTLTYSQLQTL